MKKSLIVGLLAVSSVMLSGVLHAGGSSYKPLNYKPLNYKPPSYKPLSYGSSYSSRSGSSYSKPSSYPGRGSTHMNSSAGSRTAGRLPAFSSFPPSGGNNPGSGGMSTSSIGSGMPTSVSTGKPTSFPGRGGSHMNATASSKTTGKLPSFNNFPPAGGNNTRSGVASTSSIGHGMPSSVSTGRPASLPPALPSAASAGRVPSSVPPVRSGSGMSATMPAMPAVTSTRIPDAAAGGLANRGRGRR